MKEKFVVSIKTELEHVVVVPDGYSCEVKFLPKKKHIRSLNSKEVMDEADRIKGGSVYVIKEDDVEDSSGNVKIGVTKNDSETRCKQLQTGNSRKLSVEHSESTSNPYMVERKTHEQLKKQGQHVRGEFYDIPSENAKNTVLEVKEQIEDNTFMNPDEDGWVTPNSSEDYDE
jgi:hypothetical protein